MVAKAEVVGTQISNSFLFANLLYDEPHQPWNKIIKAQREAASWEELHKKMRKKM